MSSLARTDLTITLTPNNGFVNDLSGCAAYKCSNQLTFNFSASILTHASLSDFVVIGTISGWSAIDNASQTVVQQNGSLYVITLMVASNGQIKLYSPTGTTNAYTRANMTMPCA